MRLIIEPPVLLPALSEALELVIVCGKASTPEVFTLPGAPRPDRHFLLALAESAAFALSEEDPETVVFAEDCRVGLDVERTIDRLDPGVVIVRTLENRLGVLVVGTSEDARRIARSTVRFFTSALRLDVP